MYTPMRESFGIIDSLLVTLIAVIIVFAVLTVIILVTSVSSKVIGIMDRKSNINPRKENSILKDDEDAVVASLVATIDFYKETKQNARLVSIKKIEEDIEWKLIK